MIRHMIFWNLAKPDEDLRALESFMKTSFSEMVSAIPGLWAAHIGLDVGQGTHGAGLCCDLDSMEALEIYRVHPLHVAFQGWAKEHLKERCCVDLEVAE